MKQLAIMSLIHELVPAVLRGNAVRDASGCPIAERAAERPGRHSEVERGNESPSASPRSLGLRKPFAMMSFVLVAVALLTQRVSASEERAAAAPPSTASVAARAAPDVPWSDRLRGLGGIVVILGLAYALSTDRAAVSGRIVFWGLALQWAFALLVLRVPAGERLLSGAGQIVTEVLASAEAGSRFVFGDKLCAPDGPAGFVFAFRVLPTVIFVASLFAVLYHLGLMQWMVRGCAVVMAKLMGTSGAESFNVAASLFLGQTEAPLTIRPYLPGLTRSELMTVMTAGMAHVSGGIMVAYFAAGVEPRHILTAVIMTAPGTILLSKLMVPETGVPETLGGVSTRPGTARRERPRRRLARHARRLEPCIEHRGDAHRVSRSDRAD